VPVKTYEAGMNQRVVVKRTPRLSVRDERAQRNGCALQCESTAKVQLKGSGCFARAIATLRSTSAAALSRATPAS
jgi:hypothetical protein